MQRINRKGKNGMFKVVNFWDLNFSEGKFLDSGKNAVVA
jgi:hypothetical protein